MLENDEDVPAGKYGDGVGGGVYHLRYAPVLKVVQGEKLEPWLEIAYAA
jgi:hypothetical protein